MNFDQPKTQIMSILQKLLGPKSKYDQNLPFTYMAKFSMFHEDPELYVPYFSDTLCGLIEYVQSRGMNPDEVELYGVYRDREIPLDISPCVDRNGAWLHPPKLCRSLEKFYRKTLQIEFQGHCEKEPCSYEDRDRRGMGPD